MFDQADNHTARAHRDHSAQDLYPFSVYFLALLLALYMEVLTREKLRSGDSWQAIDAPINFQQRIKAV